MLNIYGIYILILISKKLHNKNLIKNEFNKLSINKSFYINNNKYIKL